MDLDKLSLSTSASVTEALRVLDTSAAQIALVVDDNYQLLGVITDGDIRRGLLRGVTLDDDVSKVMNRNPKVLRPTDSPAAGRAAMLRYRVLHMPVVDEASGRVVGLRFLSDPRTGGFSDIPVVLMAGGEGRRLRPITEDTPKPLIQLGNRPILEHILQRFIDQGFRRFFISINYLGHMIEGYFGDGAEWDVSIEYLRENQKLGTCGALGLLPDGLAEPVIVMNGDLLTSVDFREMVHAHAESRAVATMSVREQRTYIDFGVVDAQGDVFVGVREKPTIIHEINAGIYCLSAEAFNYIPTDEFYDMPSLFQDLSDDGKRCGIYRLNAVEWLDIGTPADLERAQKHFSD